MDKGYAILGIWLLIEFGISLINSKKNFTVYTGLKGLIGALIIGLMFH
jgi:hypothetical protein